MLPRILTITTFLAMIISNAMGNHHETSEKPLLRHVVLFKFKDEATQSEVKAIEDAFRQLPSKIPSIVSFEWGTDVSIEGKNQGFTHCFLVTFADDAGREAYLPHAAHKKFVALLRPSLDKVTVVDFFAKDTQGTHDTDGKLRHVVFFDFKDGTDTDTLDAIESKFASLPGDISEIAAFEWGTNNSPEGLADGYTHCFLVTFDDEDGRAAYLPHPSHKEFGTLVRSNVEKVLVIDFVSSD